MFECKIFKSQDLTLSHFPPFLPLLPLRSFLNFLFRFNFGFLRSLADSFLEGDLSSILLEDLEPGSSEQYPSSPHFGSAAICFLILLAVVGMELDSVLGELALVQFSILLEDFGFWADTPY